MNTIAADFAADPTLVAHLTHGDNLWRITAADYNGDSWDGPPLVPVFPRETDEAPVWLLEADKAGVIEVGCPGETDYAQFGVKDQEGETVWGGPGDVLVRTVDGKVLIIGGQVFDLIVLPLLKPTEG